MGFKTAFKAGYVKRILPVVLTFSFFSILIDFLLRFKEKRQKVSTISAVPLGFARRKLALFHLWVSTFSAAPLGFAQRKLALFDLWVSAFSAVPLGFARRKLALFHLG